MSVDYAGLALIRPTAGRLPLTFRNEMDKPGAHAQYKFGPQAYLPFGPADYRCWTEKFNSDLNTNCMGFARAGNPWAWTPARDADDFLPLALGTWENGECCPTDWWYDEYDDRFKMIYHGGGNSMARQIGLLTAPRSSEGGPGGWTRYSLSPVLTNGGAGAVDELRACDATVIRVSRTLYVMLYRGSRVSDGKHQTCLATSSDLGYTWTKYGSNPVLGLGSGNDANGAYGGWGFMDELGRIHLWYVGLSATSVQRVLYAYSDDNALTWTRNATQIIADGQASTQPDDEIGDVVSGFVAGGLIHIQFMGNNIATYTGDARGRLEGRVQLWLPCKAAAQPSRPGRVFIAAGSYATVNAAAKLLASTVFTIYAEFKCPPGTTIRALYGEDLAFNKLIYLRLGTSGMIDAAMRTATANVFVGDGGGTGSIMRRRQRLDDGLFHWAAFVRTATNAFELFVDGYSVGTSTNNPGTDAGTPTVRWGGFSDTANTPLSGLLRTSLSIQGRALSLAELNALWNEGKDGGALPAGVTATHWVRQGSGGEAGPDAAYGGATHGSSVTGTSYLVNAERTPALIQPAALVRSVPQLRFG